MKPITVKDLRRAIEGLADDVEVSIHYTAYEDGLPKQETEGAVSCYSEETDGGETILVIGGKTPEVYAEISIGKMPVNEVLEDDWGAVYPDRETRRAVMRLLFTKRQASRGKQC